MRNIIVLHVRYMKSYKELIRNIYVLCVTYIITYIELILILHLAYKPIVCAILKLYALQICRIYADIYVHVYARYV
jgi:hypothetical protein